MGFEMLIECCWAGKFREIRAHVWSKNAGKLDAINLFGQEASNYISSEQRAYKMQRKDLLLCSFMEIGYIHCATLRIYTK